MRIGGARRRGNTRNELRAEGLEAEPRRVTHHHGRSTPYGLDRRLGREVPRARCGAVEEVTRRTEFRFGVEVPNRGL